MKISKCSEMAGDFLNLFHQEADKLRRMFLNMISDAECENG
jgi:hypothetical protein